jgi:hypothetical protein
MQERFRIMFVIRFPKEIEYLTVVGVDYDNACLFSVILFCRDDRISLEHETCHYPKTLLRLLEAEKELIDSGYYDVRTWFMCLMDQSLRERKEFVMSIKDRGKKKWAPFQSAPEQDVK